MKITLKRKNHKHLLHCLCFVFFFQWLSVVSSVIKDDIFSTSLLLGGHTTQHGSPTSVVHLPAQNSCFSALPGGLYKIKFSMVIKSKWHVPHFLMKLWKCWTAVKQTLNSIYGLNTLKTKILKPLQKQTALLNHLGGILQCSSQRSSSYRLFLVQVSTQ